MVRSAAVAALLALLALAAGPVAAQGTADPARVQVRAGSHDDHGRLVFEFGAAAASPRVERIDDATVRLVFDRPAAPGATPRLPRNVAGLRTVSQDPLTVELRVVPGADLRLGVLDRRAVIDVYDAAPAEAAAEAPEPAATARAGAAGDEGSPRPDAAPPESPGPPTDLRPAARPGRPGTVLEAGEDPQAAIARLRAALAGEAAEPGSAPPAEARAAERAPLERREPAPPADARSAAAPRPVAPAPAPNAPPPSRDAAAEGSGDALTLRPATPVALAVFTDHGRLFLVADGWLGAEPPRGAAGLGPGKRLPVEGGSAFVYPLPPGREVRVARDGLAWTIRLPPETEPDLPAAPVSVEGVGTGARLLLPDRPGERVLRVVDPDLDEGLLVVPVRDPANTRLARRRLADLELLEAASGVALRPHADGLRVEPGPDGTILAADGGLKLSEALLTAPRETTGPPPPDAGRLFDFGAWGRGPDAIAGRRRFEARQVGLSGEALAGVRVEMARFLVARGLAHEAMGVLRIAETDLPALADSPDFRTLRGAAAALRGGEADLAQAAFAAPDLPPSAEGELWRGFLAAEAGRWAAAYDAMSAGAALLEDYPPPLQRRLGVRLIEASLRLGDIAQAQGWMRRLRDLPGLTTADRAALRWLEGEAKRQSGDREGARAAWARAVATRDQLFGTKSTLALVTLGVEDGTLPLADAIDRLEALKFAWRGDELELAVLRRLARFYAAAGQVREALLQLRVAASLRPPPDIAQSIAAEMRALFADAFLGPEAGRLSAEAALSLYEEFRDLAPDGREGERLIGALAERLVSLDLLPQAAAMLEGRLDLLTGAERAVAGARLAAVRLLDQDPAGALAALDRTNEAGLDAALAEERRLLRARALSETGDAAAALALAEAGTGEAARRLAADIAWRAGDWPRAAAAVARLVPSAPGAGAPDPATEGLVLRLALALALAQDRAALDRLAADWGPAMATGTEGATFAALTAAPTQDTALTHAEIRARLSDIDLFRGFLAGYQSVRSGSG